MPLSSLSERKMVQVANVCQLSWIESIHHQVVPFALDLRVVRLVQSCQGVHQDRSMWSIQLHAHLKRRGMEDNV